MKVILFSWSNNLWYAKNHTVYYAKNSAWFLMQKMSKTALLLRKDFGQKLTLAEGLWSIPCLFWDLFLDTLLGRKTWKVTWIWKIFWQKVLLFLLKSSYTNDWIIPNWKIIPWIMNVLSSISIRIIHLMLFSQYFLIIWTVVKKQISHHKAGYFILFTEVNKMVSNNLMKIITQ